MSTSSDAAEQVVKIYLDGTVAVLKVTGQATKHIVAALYAISQEKNRTKGKTRLSTMLKTGKELKIFSIQEDDLKKFSQAAKKYGVLYCALISKIHSNQDGMVDIMVRAEDAPKVNRIIERYNLITIDEAQVKAEIERTKGDGIVDELMEQESEEDLLVDDILGKPKNVQTIDNNLSSSYTEKEGQLENNLKKKQNTTRNKKIKQKEKQSVREELKQFEKEIKEETLSLEKDVAEEIVVSKDIANPKENKTKSKQTQKKTAEYKHMKQNQRKNYKHLKKAKHMKNIERNR